MRHIPRIYVPQALYPGAIVELDAMASSHLLRVLRLRVGELLQVFDGQGGEYSAELQGGSKNMAQVLVNAAIVNITESALQIHLGQAISRGERMDYTLQKAVELGVHAITPLFSQFTEVKLADARLEKKMSHWRAIIISACEQSGRNYLPQLMQPLSFSKWLQQRAESLKIMMHPEHGDKLSSFVLSGTQLALLVGPEGGFSENEVVLAERSGFVLWQFGPRVLRTETVAPAALAALQCRWGDMG